MKLPINQIICGDCLKVMKDWPDNCVDLILTSPPYGDLRIYRGYHFYFEDIANNLFRILKNGGVLVWVVADQTKNGSESGNSFRQALYFKEIGCNLHDTMIYVSHKPPLTHNRYEQCFEYMFVLSKGTPKTFNPIKVKSRYFGDVKKYHYDSASANQGRAMRQRNNETYVKEYRRAYNLWEYATGLNGSTRDKIAFEHPAIFPEQLATDHIISWSNENDIVLDPMCGSGTTPKMALKFGRKYIGIDISEEYCEIARKRIKGVRPNLFKNLRKRKRKIERANFGLSIKKRRKSYEN